MNSLIQFIFRWYERSKSETNGKTSCAYFLMKFRLILISKSGTFLIKFCCVHAKYFSTSNHTNWKLGTQIIAYRCLFGWFLFCMFWIRISDLTKKKKSFDQPLWQMYTFIMHALILPANNPINIINELCVLLRIVHRNTENIARTIRSIYK